ncbi:hypothetical protein BDQ12DRAFT_562474, partial [Crucibulum laeve]
LQGASRTTGGFLHGQAYGKYENHADFNNFHDNHLGPVKGKAHLYVSDQNPVSIDPSSLKPAMTMKTEVTSTIGPVLQKFAKRYSPISSSGGHIFLYEDDTWVIKGKYDIAISDDEEANW